MMFNLGYWRIGASRKCSTLSQVVFLFEMNLDAYLKLRGRIFLQLILGNIGYNVSRVQISRLNKLCQGYTKE